jgi:hypothetical protein
MKLKNVVISMGLLGLISPPTLASVHHPHPALANQNFNHMLVTANQNVGRSSDHAAGWFNRIHIHGGLNLDSNWGPRWENNSVRGWSGMNGQSLSVNDFYLSVFSRINSWTQLRTSVDFFSTSQTYTRVLLDSRNNTGASYTFRVDQAFLTFGNLNCSPLYFQLGRSYLPFGQYKLHPMVKPFTQVLSQTNIENAQLGFISRNGLRGGVYLYESAKRRTLEGYPIIYGMYGAFDSHFQAVKYDLGVDYNNSMNNVNIINARGPAGTFTSRVAGLAAHINAYYREFDFHVRYVTALSAFDALDVPFKDHLAAGGDRVGAKPAAFDVKFGYVYYLPYVNKRAHTYVDYQRSQQTSALGVPEWRMGIGTQVDIYKDTILAIYASNNNGWGVTNRAFANDEWSSRHYHIVTVRIGAKI